MYKECQVSDTREISQATWQLCEQPSGLFHNTISVLWHCSLDDRKGIWPTEAYATYAQKFSSAASPALENIKNENGYVNDTFF